MAYNPDQPRDERGRWGEGGAGGTHAAVASTSANVHASGSRQLSAIDQKQLDIAKQTLKMNPAMAAVMGGPSPAESQAIVDRLTGPSSAPQLDEFNLSKLQGGRNPTAAEAANITLASGGGK